MKIAHYDLQALPTGDVWLDGGSMFGSVPKALWSKAHPADDKNRIHLTMRSLLIRGNDRVMIVETGPGTKWPDKLRAIYGLPEEDLLTLSLKKFDLTTDDVTDVICTHLHFDHAAGNTRFDKNQQPVPTFAKARYHVQKEHWQWAQKPTMKDRASFMPDDYMPVYEREQFNFVDGEQEIAPSIRARVANGHTPGMQLIEISDNNSKALFVADLAPTTTHTRMPYVMGYDMAPINTLEEKQRLFGEAADEGTALIFYHDPKAEVAYLERKGDDFTVRATANLSEI